MVKIPEKPESIFEEFSADFRELFGEELLSIILYGSAARGEYIPKKSDINFLIVLTDKGINNLSGALPLVEKWSKRSVAVPLFLTDIYIRSSLDAFPIEFFNIQASYKLVFGEDILEGLEIQNSDLRRECEKEIKGKLLHLRQAYFLSKGKKKRLNELFKISLQSLFTIFPVALRLLEIPVPQKRIEIMETLVEKCQLDSSVFRTLWNISDKRQVIPEDEARHLWRQYVEQVQILGRVIDRLE